MLTAISETIVGALIDLDISVVFVQALFIVLAVILNFVLFKPLMGLRAKRHEKTEGAREDAASKQSEAEELARDYETRIRDARAEGGDERHKVREAALGEQRDLLSSTRDKAEKEQSAELERVQKEYEESAKEVDAAAKKLADSIADQLLAAG